MIKLLTLAVTLLLTLPQLAFTTEKGLSVSYGVSSSNPAQILLELNDDFTFQYQDRSVPSEPIQVTGTYTQHGNRIELSAEDDTQRFHDHWRITDEGKAIKSRLGLCFYTLRRQ